MSTVFTVKRVEVVHYWESYSRDEVLDLLSLSDIDGHPSADIRAEYEGLTDEELGQAFRDELRLGGNGTTDKVYEDTERYADVQGSTFSVELEA